MNSALNSATKEELSIELANILEMTLLETYAPSVIRTLKIKRLLRISTKALKSNLEKDYLAFVEVNNELVNDGTLEGIIL